MRVLSIYRVKFRKSFQARRDRRKTFRRVEVHRSRREGGEERKPTKWKREGEGIGQDKSVGAFRGRAYASYAHATLVTYYVKTVLIFEQWDQEIFLVFTGIIVSRLRDSNARSHVSLIREE